MAEDEVQRSRKRIAAGGVDIRPSAMLRRVDHCMPEPLAIIVPATPDESICVIDTGRPRPSAAPKVEIDRDPGQEPRPVCFRHVRWGLAEET
jgi:hypothetical protein